MGNYFSSISVYIIRRYSDFRKKRDKIGQVVRLFWDSRSSRSIECCTPKTTHRKVVSIPPPFETDPGGQSFISRTNFPTSVHIHTL